MRRQHRIYHPTNSIEYHITNPNSIPVLRRNRNGFTCQLWLLWLLWLVTQPVALAACATAPHIYAHSHIMIGCCVGLPLFGSNVDVVDGQQKPVFHP